MALLMAGLLHFGFTFRAQQVITNASRVGARRGTQADSSSGAMEAAVKAYVDSAGLNSAGCSISATVGGVGSNCTCQVSLTYSSPVQAFIDNLLTRPIAGGAQGGTWWSAQPATPTMLTATTIMRY
ncbi:MAG: hypothetical protein HY650_01420 [Acidobacteria bacterium]|nr:hypothetical protein [Acidobacteriota bacterium]